MKKLFWNIDVLLINIITYIIIAVLILVSIKSEFLNPIALALNDFEFTDITHSKLSSNNENTIDSNIVIVNVGKLNRGEIALEIERLEAFSPKVIGIDVFFVDLKNKRDDSLLKKSLEYENIVIGSFFEIKEDSSSLITPNNYFGDITHGHVNLEGSADVNSVVRTFMPKINYGEQNIVINSFCSEIAKKYNLNKYNILNNRNNESEIINYKYNLNNYIRFDFDEILNPTTDLSIVKDKIVILGFIGNSLGNKHSTEDKYFTPLNKEFVGKSLPDMYGCVIHANILSTILSEDYINKSSKLTAWIIAFIISYLFTSIFFHWYKNKPELFDLYIQLTLLLGTVTLLWLSFVVYEYLNYKLLITQTIFATILSVQSIFLYEFLNRILLKYFKFKSFIYKKKWNITNLLRYRQYLYYCY